MAEINDWSTTAASNNSTPPDGWPENMVSSDVNDTAREGMAVLKRAWTDTVEGNVNSTGSAGAYIVAANRTIAAYYDGMKIAFHANHANTGAATLDVDSVGAKSITKNHDVALVANDIEVDQYVEVVYSASDDAFQMITPAATASIVSVAEDTSPQLGGFLDPNAQYIGMAKGGDIASASPLVVDTDGDYFDVTGTTGFAAMTVAANRHFFCQFDGALTMTHHATNLDLPGEANITTAAGDVAEFFSTGTDTVQCVNYTRADGTSVVSSSAITLGTEQATTSGTSITFSSIPTGTKRVTIMFEGVSLSGTDQLLVQLGDSVGIETTGYVASGGYASAGGSALASSTSGFIINTNTAAGIVDGAMTLTLKDSTNDTWTSQHSLAISSTRFGAGGGSKSLDTELTDIKILMTGSDTFDAGSINIAYG